MKRSDSTPRSRAPQSPVYVPPDLSPEAMQRYAQQARRLRARTLGEFGRAVAGYTGRGLSRLVAALAKGRARRTAIAELRRLSDRTLEDIGVPRAQIPHIVEQMLEHRGAGQATVQKPRLAPVPAQPAASAPATDDACCPPLAA